MLDGICQCNDKYSYIINDDENNIIIDKNGIHDLTIKKVNNLNIEVLENINAIVNIFEYDENKLEIKLNISKNSKIGYYVYSYKSNEKNTYIFLNEASYLKVYNMEIGYNTDIFYNIKLLGENSFLDYNYVLYSDYDNVNKLNLKVEHLNRNTKAVVRNIGVLNDNASCTFDVNNYIKEGSKGTDVTQKNSILCLSDNCISKINPMLEIDEYDVSASHSATVSKINSNDLYYLMSRGIKEDSAKKVVSIGYLLMNAPRHIEEYLNDMLEKRFNDERI